MTPLTIHLEENTNLPCQRQVMHPWAVCMRCEVLMGCIIYWAYGFMPEEALLGLWDRESRFESSSDVYKPDDLGEGLLTR